MRLNEYPMSFYVPRVIAILMNRGAILAGSSVLRLWYNKDIVVSDWDMYITPEDFAKCSFLSTPEYYHYLKNSEIPANVARYTFGNVKIDINITDKPIEMILSTDLDICKTFYKFNDNDKTIVYSYLTKDEHENKKFRYMKPHISYLNARRIKKYTKYGYTAYDQNIHNIINDTHAKMIEDEIQRACTLKADYENNPQTIKYIDEYERDLHQSLLAIADFPKLE